MPVTHTGLFRAWIALTLALAAHVADEALTHFLSVYNPTVVALRERVPWLPLPTFRFDVWLGGLILALAALLVLSRYAGRGARWIGPLGYVFAILMLANAMGHILGTIFGRTVASIRIPRPMPGFYSSPLLVAASIWLLRELRRTARTSAGIAGGGA